MFVIFVLFVLAGLCETRGGYLVWGWMREDKPRRRLCSRLWC